MRKLFVLVFAFSAMAAQAQKGFTFGGGLNVGLPVGDAGDISSFAVGGELQGELNFSSKASAVFTSGYTHFIGKDLGDDFKINYGAVPVLAGVRFYPSEKFFIGGQLGYGFFTGDASGGGFAYKPQIGLNTSSAQLALSYNAISNNGTIGWIGLSGILKFGGAKSAAK